MPILIVLLHFYRNEIEPFAIEWIGIRDRTARGHRGWLSLLVKILHWRVL